MRFAALVSMLALTLALAGAHAQDATEAGETGGDAIRAGEGVDEDADPGAIEAGQGVEEDNAGIGAGQGVQEGGALTPEAEAEGIEAGELPDEAVDPDFDPESLTRLRDVETRIEALEDELDDLDEERLLLREELGLPLQVDVEADLTRRETFALIREESAERMEELEDEYEELEGLSDDELEDSAAWREWRRNRMDYLQALARVEREILQLDGPEELDRARELLLRLQELRTRWYMVAEPRLTGRMELEQMENLAMELDDDDLFQIVRQARQEYEEDIELSEQLYELWLQRARSRGGLQGTSRQFWSRAAVLRRRRAEPEEGDGVDLEDLGEDKVMHENDPLIEQMQEKERDENAELEDDEAGEEPPEHPDMDQNAEDDD